MMVYVQRKSDVEDTNIDTTKKPKVSLDNEEVSVENGLKSVNTKHVNGDADEVSAVETVKVLISVSC